MNSNKFIVYQILPLLLFSLITGCTEGDAGLYQNDDSEIKDQMISESSLEQSPSAVFVDQSPLPLKDLTYVVYSDQFASRFGLEKSGVNPSLNPDLHAIEFSVERYANISPDIYSCIFKVYVNSELPLRYPEDLPISNSDAINAHHFFDEKFDGWKKEDIQRYSKRLSEYNMKAFLSTAPYSIRQLRESMNTNEHYEQLFEGIDYIKLSGCMIFADKLLAENIHLQLWLELERGKDYTRDLDVNPDDFVKFDLPIDFTNHIGPMMEKVSEKMFQLNSITIENKG